MCEAELADTPGNMGSRGLVCECQRRRRENFSVRDRKKKADITTYFTALLKHCTMSMWLRLIPLTEDREDETENILNHSCQTPAVQQSSAKPLFNVKALPKLKITPRNHIKT